LLFSCCCARVDFTWTPVCDCFLHDNKCNQDCLEASLSSENIYFSSITSLFLDLETKYPDATIWLVGHSLGGAIAALVGQIFAVPVITFQAPGDRLAATRLHLPMPPAVDYRRLPVWQFGHTADPIFMGTCTVGNAILFRQSCYLLCLHSRELNLHVIMVDMHLNRKF
jgi:lipase ATG15